MRIAVAGGTGLIGRMVCDAVSAGGDEAVVLARSVGVDVVSGDGLDAALVGVDAVIDVTNVTTVKRSESIAFFETATRNLLAAEERAGVVHHVLLSIVGVDRVDWGYYAGKVRQEELCAASAVPTTVLRATQFHEFADQMLARGGPVALVPKMLSRPVAAREVATELVRLARGQAQGLVPEMAGPEDLEMPDMVRKLLRSRGRHTPVLGIRLPGAAGRGMAHGALLPEHDGPRGRETFAQWLTAAQP
ncbi:SDR family oxidoreductase [uncultured Williamsia sp.]|uniref:SDR family oxidoreductase n=1 Tax=uncultured Williamsia sp. TaxID=259311 RepID=UPI002639263F|nr:NAD(P)H-binding protein [uncultured Williamsia sp.]